MSRADRGGRCNQRHGWSARGNRREGVVTRARRSRTSPNTQNPRAEARMRRPARGGARESRQKRTIPTPPQGCAAGDAVQTPGKGATGEGRLTQSPRGRFNDRERVLRRHRATKNAPRRLASTPARARPPKGCAWRDPNAHPRARIEKSASGSKTAKRRSCDDRDAKTTMWGRARTFVEASDARCTDRDGSCGVE